MDSHLSDPNSNSVYSRIMMAIEDPSAARDLDSVAGLVISSWDLFDFSSKTEVLSKVLPHLCAAGEEKAIARIIDNIKADAADDPILRVAVLKGLVSLPCFDTIVAFMGPESMGEDVDILGGCARLKADIDSLCASLMALSSDRSSVKSINELLEKLQIASRFASTGNVFLICSLRRLQDWGFDFEPFRELIVSVRNDLHLPRGQKKSTKELVDELARVIEMY